VSRINEAVDDQTRLWAWVKKKFLGYAQRCIIQQPDGVYFLPARLKKMDEDVGLQIFLGWWLQSLGLTGAEVRRACEEMNSKTGSRWLFKTGTLLKVVNGWKWAKIGTSPTAEVSISVFGEGNWSASGWEIQIGSGKCLPAWSLEEASVAWFDMEAVSWPLEIRPNKPGDRISIGSEKKGWTDVTQRIVLSQKRDIVVGSCQLLALDSRGEVVMVSDGSVAQRFKGLVGKGRIGFFACVWRGHTI